MFPRMYFLKVQTKISTYILLQKKDFECAVQITIQPFYRNLLDVLITFAVSIKNILFPTKNHNNNI